MSIEKLPLEISFLIFNHFFKKYEGDYTLAAMPIQPSLLDPLAVEVVEFPVTSHDFDDTEIARRNDLEIAAAVDEALNSLRVHRPKNTTKVYLPKQKEWKVNTIFLYIQT